MKVFFVGVHHGPHSGLVDSLTGDSRYVTKDVHKAQEYYNRLVAELRGGCEQCGSRFEQLESIGKMIDRATGEDHGDCPFWGEENQCRPQLEQVTLVDELDVLPYIQRELDVAFNDGLKTAVFDWGLSAKTDAEMALKDYSHYRKPVKFDHYYEEGIINGD